jgi:coenzyme F420-0:L-glutamate ligase/coenzyme F420-1:gamma-L-glutamate ligase
MKTLNLYALEDIPLIQQGDNIGTIICRITEKEKFSFENNDIVVVTSKIVSKAEGRLVDTYKIEPSEETIVLAKKLEMDPRKLEVILGETRRVLIVRSGLIVTEDRLGFISTSAGVDSSNTLPGPKGQVVSLLPEDPDSSAKRIRKTIKQRTGKKIAVIINDTFGRADRKGSVGMAIGISGIAAVYYPPIREDIHGKKRSPEIAQIDEIAAAASLIMGQTNERRPVVIVRGVDFQPSETATIKDILHPVEKYIVADSSFSK